jgi:hypothetical protein
MNNLTSSLGRLRYPLAQQLNKRPFHNKLTFTGNLKDTSVPITPSTVSKAYDTTNLAGFSATPFKHNAIKPVAHEQINNLNSSLSSQQADLVVSPNGDYSIVPIMAEDSTIPLKIFKDPSLLNSVLAMAKTISEHPFIQDSYPEHLNKTFTIILMKNKYNKYTHPNFFESVHRDKFLASGVATLKSSIPSRLVGYARIGDYHVPIGVGKDTDFKLILHYKKITLTAEHYPLIIKALEDPLVKIIPVSKKQEKTINSPEKINIALRDIWNILITGETQYQVTHKVIIDPTTKESTKLDSKHATERTVLNVSFLPVESRYKQYFR